MSRRPCESDFYPEQIIQFALNFLEPVQKPSSGASSVTEAAPRKLFKQRYLADEQAKQVLVV